MRNTAHRRVPVATIAVLATTGVVTSLQCVFHSLLDSLERTPNALARHEWWRLITPLFVHAGGWRQIAFNFPAIFILGSLAERIFTRRQWLLLYSPPDSWERLPATPGSRTAPVPRLRGPACWGPG
ncbi:MAG TPA: rhomboid family intramembrane serine protease [Candidatus Cybelea sp.]|nr:rhomboid family intramembrane serine protease [Candidatus Cybelea sp.]